MHPVDFPGLSVEYDFPEEIIRFYAASRVEIRRPLIYENGLTTSVMTYSSVFKKGNSLESSVDKVGLLWDLLRISCHQ